MQRSRERDVDKRQEQTSEAHVLYLLPLLSLLAEKRFVMTRCYHYCTVPYGHSALTEPRDGKMKQNVANWARKRILCQIITNALGVVNKT